MSAIILQVVNMCVLGMGFYQFLCEGKRLMQKMIGRVKISAEVQPCTATSMVEK